MHQDTTLYTKPRPGFLGRIVHFWPIRIVLYGASIAAAVMLVDRVASLLGSVLGGWWPAAAGRAALLILAVHFVYRGMTRLLEDRSTFELSRKGAPQETAAGTVFGAVCLSITVAAVAAFGYYRVESIGEWTVLLPAFGIAATSSYLEEILFRGVLFRIVEEALGTWFAFGVSIAFFGAAHLSNPSATYYGAAAIGIEAGLLLGAAYVVTRKLWLPIGIHFGWNFMQAGVFGPHVSGVTVDSLLQSRLSGPELLSGGALGVEGSLFAVLVCVGLSALFLLKARRRGLIIPPFWRRKRSH